MAVAFAFHSVKAVVQIAAIEITVDQLLDIRPPKSVLTWEMFIINLYEGFKMIVYATVIIRLLWTAGLLNAGGQKQVLLAW